MSLDRREMTAASALLDALRDHPEWDEATRAGTLDRLVGGFDRGILIEAIGPRLADLSGGDFEALVRLVESLADPGLFEALADGLVSQPDLDADRAWEALGVLEGSGRIEARPELLDRLAEIEDLISSDEPFGELASQIEDDPESTWVALGGLGAIEPEVRREIITGLGDEGSGPGVSRLLRLLSFAADDVCRSAAIEALSGPIGDSDDGRLAWAAIAADHPDARLRAIARDRLGESAEDAVSAWRNGPDRPSPTVRGSAVGGLDRDGRGPILFLSEDRGEWVVASFVCDVTRGVTDVLGGIFDGFDRARGLFDGLREKLGPSAATGADDLARMLLSGALWLGSEAAGPALPFWIERSVGPGFRPAPILADAATRTGETASADPMASRAEAVLEALPDLFDDSDLAGALAEEIRLRDGDSPPDPELDSGAFRYLFEHRLQGRLETYRRMLLWTSAVWGASGHPWLAEAALRVAQELADPGLAVPGHPFLLGLAARSLARAGRGTAGPS